MIRLVLLSDTHEFHRQITVPEGDVLVHAGDATWRGSNRAVQNFDDWLGGLPHRYKVFVPGNHDFYFERNPKATLKNATVLLDSAVEIQGLLFYGSPYTPAFCDWAFQLHGRRQAKAKWKGIPSRTRVLVTHGPPFSVLDWTDAEQTPNLGCRDLLTRVAELSRPLLNVFGHIHGGYGQRTLGEAHFVNASICDEAYRPVNPPIVVDVTEAE